MLIELKKALWDIGLQLTDAQLQEFVNLYPFDQVYEQELQSLSYEVWDKQSSINGVSASYFLNQYPNADVIYLIKKDNNVLFVQPHHPFLSGFVQISIDQVDEIATQHMEHIAKMFAFQKWVELAVNYFSQ